LELGGGRGVPGAAVEIIRREISFDESGRARLKALTGEERGIVWRADEGGNFAGDLPKGFVAVRVLAEGFEEYFNVLAAVDESKELFVVELVKAELSELERNLIEQRRVALQARARAEAGALEVFVPEALDRAAAEPVAPTDVQVVNLNGYTGLMNLDEFIAGVVSLEMGDGFPYESLKAQAVAARAYALARLRERGQANGGQAYTSTLGSRSRAAALNSSGVALTYNSAYITAFFSARCNGDFTLDSEDGLSGLETCAVGGLVGGQAIPYCRKAPCSGHVNCAQTSEQCCDVTVDGRAQYLYGHGVGLCQRGAQQLAGRDGLNWRQIVNRYYTAVTTLPGRPIALGDRVEMVTTANRRTVACTGTTTSTPQGTAGTLIAGPMTMACGLIAGTSYITWWRVAFPGGARGWVAEDFLAKAPAVQAAPQVGLSVALIAVDAVRINATGRANVRVVLEESGDFKTWSDAATNTFSTDGLASFSRTTGDERFYRARMVLPDTAP
jgi:hypothetical protein